MASIFSRIISGEIPCYKVAETDSCLAFLDIFPLTRGHVLCVPKKEVDYLFDLEEQEYLELMAFSRRVALAIQQVIPCERLSVAVLGFEVPHAHVHLIPSDSERDANFSNPKLKLGKEEFLSIAEKISAAYALL